MTKQKGYKGLHQDNVGEKEQTVKDTLKDILDCVVVFGDEIMEAQKEESNLCDQCC